MPAPRRFTEIAAGVAAALFLVSWGVLHRGWYADNEIVDIPVYADYGNAIEEGSMPYRDFRPEYPPGALPAFAVPALLSDDDEGFRDVFEWLMAACGVVCVLLVAVALAGLRASRARTAAALALTATFPLLLGSVVLTRFDLLPAAFVAGSLAALVWGRNRLGLGLLGVAVGSAPRRSSTRRCSFPLRSRTSGAAAGGRRRSSASACSPQWSCLRSSHSSR